MPSAEGSLSPAEALQAPVAPVVAPLLRGRIDKRRAILSAAFEVFAREGYGPASVDTIAAEAGVAKPTIYSHFGGKEQLFRSVFADYVERASSRLIAALGSLPSDDRDAPGQVRAIAHRLVLCYTDPQAWALQRLLYAESVRFPDLWDATYASGVQRAYELLAGRLARLANAGQLRIPDPDRAARQLVALISADLPGLTALGARPLDPAQLAAIVDAGVDTFLRAFRPAAG